MPLLTTWNKQKLFTHFLRQWIIASLFGRDYKTISKHINNALKEELAGSVVVAKFANTTQHGAIKGKTQTHEINLCKNCTGSAWRQEDSKTKHSIFQFRHDNLRWLPCKFQTWCKIPSVGKSALPLPCSFGSLIIITFYIIQTAPSVLQIAPLSP